MSELYASFDAGTIEELWDTQDELEHSLTENGTIQRYIDEELGNNLLYGHRTIAIIDLMDDIHDVAFRLAAEILRRNNGPAYDEFLPFLAELKTFSRNRKVDIFDYDRRFTDQFSYDFMDLIANEFKTMPKKLATSIELSFQATDDQKSYLRHQLFMQGNHLAGKTKLLGRMPVSKLHRPAVLAGDSNLAGDSRDRLNAIGSTRISSGEFT